MATHTYTVTGITHSNDNATVSGSVDGVLVLVQCNYSAIQQQPTTTAFQNFIAPLMLAQAFPPQPANDSTRNGTFVQ